MNQPLPNLKISVVLNRVRDDFLATHRGSSRDSTLETTVRIKKSINTSTFVVEIGNTTCVVKLRPKLTSLNGWLKFRNLMTELKFFNQYRTVQFSNLKIPKLICSDFKSYLAVEFLEGYHPQTCGTYCDRLYQAIYEFNTSGEKILWGRNGCLDFVTRAPLAYIIRNALRLKKISKSFSLNDFVRCLYLAAKLYRKQTTIPFMFLMHNDLGNTGNVIVSSNDDYTLIDFGAARSENRFILMDIATIALNFTSVEVDFSSFVKYYKNLSDGIRRIVCLKTQMHFCLIGRFLYLLNNHHHDLPQDSIQYRFLTGVLLKEHSFEKWFDKNMEKYRAQCHQGYV
jgi:hypothetical protein